MERRNAGYEAVQDCPKGMNVSLGAELISLPKDLLRRHVRRRSIPRPVVCQTRAGRFDLGNKPRNAEIGDLRGHPIDGRAGLGIEQDI